jgi:hypothetical protein
MDVEKNFTSSVDRKENKPFGFGGSETQKITRSNNPPIKVTLFWTHYESERDTGAGHYAWTSHRIQGKPRMHWLDSIKEATSLHLDVLAGVQDRKKWCMLVEEKTRNRGCTNVK